MFDINSTLTESFNLGTTDKPKNILLASDLTHDEREIIKEIIKKGRKYLTGVTRTCQVSTGKSQGIESLPILTYHL